MYKIQPFDKICVNIFFLNLANLSLMAEFTGKLKTNHYYIVTPNKNYQLNA